MNRDRVKIQTEFYVAPSGNDRNPGTKLRPFATPGAARDAVRTMNGDMRGDIVVHLKGGRYRLADPFVLEARDSGTNGFRVIYRGASAEPAILDGGTTVSGWKPGEYDRWTAALDLAAMRQLYVNGRRIARTYMSALALGPLELLKNGKGYRTTNGEAAALVGVEGMEFVYRVGWAHTRCRVAEVRKRRNHYEILMQQPGFFHGLHKDGVQLNDPAPRIEGAPLDFRGPCLWWFDPKRRVLHYTPGPEQDMAGSEFVVPRLEKLVEIRGTPGKPVRNVTFRNVAFEHATWLEPESSGLIDLQANVRVKPDLEWAARHAPTAPGGKIPPIRWRDGVKSPANVVCHAGHNIVFDGCRFRRLGGAGLDIERGSSGVRVANCEFDDISGNAIQVADVTPDDYHPDDRRKVVRDVEIADCRIHHAAAEYKGGVGVFIGYARDVRVLRNDIHHLPYTAVSVGWGWGEEDAGGGHSIENNRIHDFMSELNDGGAIYTLGRMPGTIVRGNRIHDSVGPGGHAVGIYLDQGSANIRVERNRIYRVRLPMHLNNRPEDRHLTCSIENNIYNPPADEDTESARGVWAERSRIHG